MARRICRRKVRARRPRVVLLASLMFFIILLFQRSFSFRHNQTYINVHVPAENLHDDGIVHDREEAQRKIDVPHKLIIDDSAMKKTRKELILDRSMGCNNHINKWQVPRGQSYFYGLPESRRLGSFEIWRPLEKVQNPRDRHTNAKKKQSGEESDILIIMQTSSTRLWNNVPMQLLTMLERPAEFVIYSDFPDSVGGFEVKDALMHVDPSIIAKEDSFEAYRILNTIRNSHVSVSADQVTIPGIGNLEKFLMLPMLYEAFQSHPYYNWYVIVDDQTSLFDNNISQFLRNLDPSDRWYLGEAIQGPACSFASIKAGIVLSHHAMKQAFDMPYDVAQRIIYKDFTLKAIHEPCGDYMLAAYLKKRIGKVLDTSHSGSLFQGESIMNIKIRASNWCSTIGSLGRQRPRDIELLAEYSEVKGFYSVTYGDIYLDFIKPYLSPDLQHNWDNGASDVEYSPADEENSNVHKSLAHCREACFRDTRCLMLRYDQYSKYCGLGISSVSLGGPIIHYNTGPDENQCKQHNIRCEPRKRSETMSSEWFIDRIRAMRGSIECDILHIDPGSEGIEHGSLDQVEGWWHRAKQDPAAS